ncbi:MAG: transglutaminase domain-containing protein [Algibacter sp.]
MRILVILITLCFSTTTFSQGYKFGKVSKEELQETSYPTDSSANAAYLYKSRRTFFDYEQTEGFQLITEIHERIKIYNQEGFGYASKSVHLYKSGNQDKELYGLKGYTYNLVDGEVEEVKLKKEGVFKTELSKYYNESKFTMPNIKEGSVIEYKYQIKSPFYWRIDEFEFQHAIPIKKVEATFEAPEYFSFKLNTKGFLSIMPEKETKRDKLSYKSEIPVNENRNNDPVVRYRTGEVDFFKNVTSFNLTDIPALKEEAFVNNINNYRSAIKYELSYTKFPSALIKYYSTTWEDVVKKIYESPNFGTELKKTGYFEKDIDDLITGVSDPVKKAALIFNFVKSNVKWNNYYSAYTSGGVRKAYKEHTGNVAEINLMLTAMLRYAGLDANPILVSTRSNGIPLFPTLEGYNYVISGIEVPNDVILLDATVKNSMPNILPFRALNWKGRIVRKSGSSATVDLYPKERAKTTISFMANLSEDGGVEGSMRTTKTGHKAMNFRSDFNDKDEEQFIEDLENKYGGIEIETFNVKNNKDFSKPVFQTIKFSMEDQADIINDKIYFSPFFFLSSKENPFKVETREFPVDFGYPTSSSYRFIINIPEDYKVESIPESAALKLPEDLGAFVYKIVLKGNQIHVNVNYNINSPIISSLYYEALKAYFKVLIEKENEQIVLIKV